MTASDAPRQVMEKALARAVRELGIAPGELKALASLLGPASDTSSGRQISMPKPVEWSHALALLEAYQRACSLVSGDDEQLRLWAQSFNRALGDAPAKVLTTPAGANAVLEYLRRFETH